MVGAPARACHVEALQTVTRCSVRLLGVRGWLLFVVAGCGRIAFDPVGDGGGSPSGDGRLGDGGGGGAGDGGTTDAASACGANALTLQPLTPYLVDTCAGNSDVFDGCGPASTKEVIFKFTVPATGGYSFRARDPGTMNVSNSTGVINAGCTGTTTCAGIYSAGFTAGQIVYFAIEASSGGCTMVEFENF